MAAGKIRVLVVEAAETLRILLAQMIGEDQAFEIVGEAKDPYEARDMLVELEPDMMTLGMEMPDMNGVDFLKVLLPQWPMPVVAVSREIQYGLGALSAGASYFLEAPVETDRESVRIFRTELIRCLKSAGRGGRSENPSLLKEMPVIDIVSRFSGIIALGASTGGTQATASVLRALPEDIPGMVVTQHMPPGFTAMYAEGLDQSCAMSVREAQDGDEVVRGRVLIAPGDKHMEVVLKGKTPYVRCYSGQKVNGHCPSVDVLFFSVAKTMGRNAVGMILTGMGADGARGITEMRRKGAFTIGQDEKSCIVYGMPREAYEMGGISRQISLELMPTVLLAHLKG